MAEMNGTDETLRDLLDRIAGEGADQREAALIAHQQTIEVELRRMNEKLERLTRHRPNGGGTCRRSGRAS
jgi:hypothetical protein